MSFLDRLLGKSTPTPSSAERAPRAVITDCFLQIDHAGFMGRYRASPSGEWLIGWDDSDPSGTRGGARQRGHGRYLLFNTRTQAIVQDARLLARPSQGHVADNGVFALVDHHFGQDLSGTFHVFTAQGEPRIKRTLTANIHSSALSPDGHYAAFQAAGSSSTDDLRLVFLDVEAGRELFAVRSANGMNSQFRFECLPPRLLASSSDLGFFAYDAGGTFIDAERYLAARLDSPDSGVALMAASDLLKDETLSPDALQRAREAVRRARRNGADTQPTWAPMALKLEGLASERLGDVGAACQCYEQALSLDPKIGVRQRLATLTKRRSKDNKR